MVRYVGRFYKIVRHKVRGYVWEKFWIETIDGRLAGIDPSAQHRESEKHVCFQRFYL